MLDSDMKWCIGHPAYTNEHVRRDGLKHANTHPNRFYVAVDFNDAMRELLDRGVRYLDAAVTLEAAFYGTLGVVENDNKDVIEVAMREFSVIAVKAA